MGSETTTNLCQLCGEPMPRGEEMFNYHGYSGPCPKPPIVETPPTPTGAASGAAAQSRSFVEAHVEALIAHLAKKLGVADDQAEVAEGARLESV